MTVLCECGAQKERGATALLLAPLLGLTGTDTHLPIRFHSPKKLKGVPAQIGGLWLMRVVQGTIPSPQCS